jgi:hypothetical protein
LAYESPRPAAIAQLAELKKAVSSYSRSDLLQKARASRANATGHGRDHRDRRVAQLGFSPAKQVKNVLAT